jgi:RNA polymerase sigma-32 factor
METRLSGGDVALEPQNDDGEESYAPIAYLADELRADPGHGGARTATAARRRHRLALDSLDARSRRIVEERWLRSTTTRRRA